MANGDVEAALGLDARRAKGLLAAALLCVGAALGCGLQAARAEVAMPDTPAGRVLAAWLEASHSGDPARLDSYYKKYDPEKHTADPMDLRDRAAGFELVSIEKSEPLRIVFLLKQRNSEMRALASLQVSDSDPPRATGSEINPIAPGAAVLGYDIDAATRARVIDGAIAKLDEFYVFPGLAKKMGLAIRARAGRGEYDLLRDGTAFAKRLTEDFRDVSHDKHLFVTFSPIRLPEESPAPSPDAVARYRMAMQEANCGFEKLERLNGNVGYLKFNFFADPEICGATAVAAMNFLANVDAVIFDLRDNRGGDPKMVALVSTYLFAKQTHLNDLWERKSGETTQYWTLPYVPGKRLSSVPAFILASHRTFSGGEEFANDLKVLKRATIVGEVTGGGAHPVAGHRIDDRFTIGVPFARAINPTTHTDWEGVGVEPDMKVPADDALGAAQTLAAKEIAAHPGPKP